MSSTRTLKVHQSLIGASLSYHQNKYASTTRVEIRRRPDEGNLKPGGKAAFTFFSKQPLWCGIGPDNGMKPVGSPGSCHSRNRKLTCSWGFGLYMSWVFVTDINKAGYAEDTGASSAGRIGRVTVAVKHQCFTVIDLIGQHHQVQAFQTSHLCSCPCKRGPVRWWTAGKGLPPTGAPPAGGPTLTRRLQVEAARMEAARAEAARMEAARVEAARTEAAGNLRR